MVQHANIPDNQLHEPKGVASAVANTVYQANGSGSGVWAKLGSLVLKGLTGDSGQSNLKVVSSGDNGFKLVKDIAFVQMGISGNSNAFTIGAASAANLNTLGDYVQLAGTGAPWGGGLGQDASYSSNQILVGVAGVYELTLVATVTTFPANISQVGFKLRVNGTTYLPRKAIAQSSTTNAIVQGTMREFVSLAANDTIQVCIASSVAGGVVVGDLSLTAKLIRAT